MEAARTVRTLLLEAIERGDRFMSGRTFSNTVPSNNTGGRKRTSRIYGSSKEVFR